MSLFEDVMALAVQLPMEERERLARALGIIVHPPSGGRTLPLNQFVARPDPVAWRKAETGHAVLALLESLNAEGVAVVLVTHDREVADRARRQIVMRDGVIVEENDSPAGGRSRG